MLLYLLCNLLLRILRKKQLRSILLKAAVMLLCPVAGVGFMALGSLCHKLFFYREVDLADVVFSKDRVRTNLPAMEEKESNIVPVEEAMSIADKDNLRKMMLQIVQGDLKHKLAAIATALNSDDSETSHYAASALQNVLGEFRFLVQKNYEEIKGGGEKAGESEEERGKRMKLAEETLDLMGEVMGNRLLVEKEQALYADIMEEICRILLEEESRLTVKRLEVLCLQLLYAENYEKCREWCSFFYLRNFGDAEPYICRLKLYFATGDRRNFFSTLEELRSLEVDIDKETLELIRIFV